MDDRRQFMDKLFGFFFFSTLLFATNYLGLTMIICASEPTQISIESQVMTVFRYTTIIHPFFIVGNVWFYRYHVLPTCDEILLAHYHLYAIYLLTFPYPWAVMWSLRDSWEGTASLIHSSYRDLIS